MQHFDTTAELNILFAIGTGSPHAPRIFKEVLNDDFFDNTSKTRFKKFHQAYQSGQLSEFAKQNKDKLDIPETVLPLWDAVKTVRNHSIRRKIENVMSNVSEKCRDYSVDLTGVQSEIKELLLEAIDQRAVKAPSYTKDDLSKVVDGLQNTETAFYTGLPIVDISAPIQPSDFVIIGARPGVGKSALVAGMIQHNFIKQQTNNGLFFCIEMDARQSYARISSQMSGVSLGKYLNSRTQPPTGGDLSAIQDSFTRISEQFPERWFVEGAISLQEICDIVEIYRPKWIVVDYVQIINERGDMQEKCIKISTTLRQLGLKTGTAIVALAQLNRDAEGKPPSISNIKGSGQFEQDATHIFLLDRPESEPGSKVQRWYMSGAEKVYMTCENGKTDKAGILVHKNRNGRTFSQVLNFHPETITFTEHEAR